MPQAVSDNLYQRTFECLMHSDPGRKREAVAALRQAWQAGELSRDGAAALARIEQPGRPERPHLVAPSEVPRRSTGTVAGRVRLAHAIAHIEFNAINLALDAVYRFRDMPDDYYNEWLQVADEEAMHFSLCDAYLGEHGSGYGEFDAHNGLWEMALKTDQDVLVRMALVPRVLEARGLDVTPGMISQLERAGDDELVSVLRVIFRDEIGHVRIGNRWFRHCCDQRGVDASKTFFDLVEQYTGGPLPGPFEHEARLDAGFTENELEILKVQAIR